MDVLIVSHSTLKEVNRKVYKHLSEVNRLEIGVVVPKSIVSNGVTIKADKFNQINDTRIHLLNLKGSNPKTYYFKGLLQLLIQQRPTIVYIDNDPVSLVAMLLTIYSRFLGFKLFCLSLENISLNPFYRLKRQGFRGFILGIFKYLVFRIMSLGVKHVFVVNSKSLEIFQNAGYKSVSKIPLGYDPQVFYFNDKFRTDIRSAYKITDVAFAFIGRLAPVKGIDILLESLALNLDLKWHLFLDDFDHETKHGNFIKLRIQELGLANRVVHYTASHNEIAHFINAFDAVILPSVTLPRVEEQYGRVIQETQACKKLMIVSDSGALKETLGNGGVVFKEGDITQLAKLLRKVILKISDFDEIINYGYNRANSQMQIKNQAQKMYSEFKSML
jgi:glycosyltransferase involved in cell wall biosynthesis